ncbi:hypothetical protein MSAN_01201900 [Mycena sanguinolenta]|uniref:Uncharacterized protein n=1 Tax=Mycena sanguinolenta TaxID=230812 RepID=A0A8H7D427_9AGAR|nr:hypothetical protein MSAN_01201900 [Mycena sanguinolenta]
MVEVAQEIINAIVDAVAASDDLSDRLTEDKSLRACALTTRAFVVPAQRQLFHIVDVTASQMERLISKLTAASHLASYIRHFNLRLPMGPSYHRALGTLFALLTETERFALWVSKLWLPISGEFWTAFCSNLRALPSLRCFAVISCGPLPKSLVRHALCSYEEVAFVNCTVDPCRDFPIAHRPDSRARNGLRHLVVASHLGLEDEVLRDFLLSPDVDLQHLRYLGLSVSDEDSLILLNQIAFRTDSVERLELDFDDTSSDEPVKLPSIPGLRCLTLRQKSIKILRIRDDIISLLATLHDHTPNLEIVTIIIDLLNPWLSQYATTSGCEPADRALKKLRRLRKVHFKICPMCKQVTEFIEDARENLLPEANAADLLVFTSGSGHLIHEDD